MKVAYAISNDFCPQTLFAYGTYQENGRPDFGLFCWFSYCWMGQQLGVMAAVGGSKLTLDRIHANKMFSANLVTESILPLADYFGSQDGYDAKKMDISLAVEPGRVLNVPILTASPVSFELELKQSIPQEGSEILLCRVRNLLVDESLADQSKSIEERLRAIAPVRTTCMTYFGYDGRAMGKWHEPGRKIEQSLK